MEQNPKQIVAEKIRTGSSVLVTVSKNPSVDQLASAVGLTLMLNALGKHTTAVFSGEIPSTVEFLRPEETFDETVDGLRDFIISLSKDKADKLRYKVEDDIVKIFITPYKDKITESDLDFSQGDYNVDLVIALGVHKREDLDEAITAHGRILHDATIVTINSSGQPASGVGSVDWTDENASCLSEMLVSISEALQGGILDAAMSTAFLTGIVSETDRFKNDKTTPRLMTMSAQLMAAGANQQLIATNLQLDAKPPEKKSQPNEVSLHEGEERKPKSSASDKPKPSPDKVKPEPDVKEGTFNLDDAKSKIHDDSKLDEIEKELHAEHGKPEDGNKVEDKLDGDALKKLENEVLSDKDATLDDIEGKVDSAKGQDQRKVVAPSEKPSGIGSVKGQGPLQDNPSPALGGTFNATSEAAHNAVEEERARGLNKEMLSHDVQPSTENAAPQQPADSTQTLGGNVDDARKAVEAAMQSAPYSPNNDPTQSVGAQPLPGVGLHDETSQPTQTVDPSAFPVPQAPQPTQQPQQPMQQPQQGYPQMPLQQPNNGVQNTPPPMPQQSPIMPGSTPPNNGVQNPPQQMYTNPPQQPYPNQNSGNNSAGSPPQVPPGGPPPMPNF